MSRDAYLAVLDKRIKAVRDALVDGFGVEPARVLQNAYEPIQFDETGSYCGNQATLGMDVHPSLKVNKARLAEAADVAGDLAEAARLHGRDSGRRDCPAGLATGSGTGFRFITEHVADFSKRGICARDPTRALIDQASMKMPRRSKLTQDWEPYSPAGRAALCASLAADPQSERRVPDREHASRGHLAVRHPPAGLCGARPPARSTRPPRDTRSSPTT